MASSSDKKELKIELSDNSIVPKILKKQFGALGRNRSEFLDYIHENDGLEKVKRTEFTFYVKQTSPEKFERVKKQITAGISQSGLSPLKARQLRNRNQNAEKNGGLVSSSKSPRKHASLNSAIPPWFHPVSVVQVVSTEHPESTVVRTLELSEWLTEFEHDVLKYNSIGSFAEVKLKEAFALSKSIHVFPNRFRTAVACNLTERIVYALVGSKALAKYSWLLFTLRDELFQSIFVDYNAPSLNNTPRTLSAFMRFMPFFAQMREKRSENHDKVIKHHEIFRKAFQSTFKSVGQVFHAWKLLVMARKEDEMYTRATHLTVKLLSHRGQLKLVFNAWGRYALKKKYTEDQKKNAKEKEESTQIISELEYLVAEKDQTIEELEKEVNELKNQISSMKMSHKQIKKHQSTSLLEGNSPSTTQVRTVFQNSATSIVEHNISPSHETTLRTTSPRHVTRSKSSRPVLSSPSLSMKQQFGRSPSPTKPDHYN